MDKDTEESEGGEMKYECKSCGLECSIEANFEPTVCLKTGIICYGWHKVTAPAPKPLSEVPGQFDPSDWQNSLIKRPEKKTLKTGDLGSALFSEFNERLEVMMEKKKLPDWCKVGTWVWCADCRAERKIEAINGNRITVRFPAPDATSYTGDVSEFKPIVPFTLETITPLLPLIVREKGSNTNFTSVIVHASTVGVWIGAASIAISYEQLMNNNERLDGSPCGVLEVAEVGK